MTLPRIELLEKTELLSGWSRVVRFSYKLFRKNGQELLDDRDLLDRGDGVTVLLCNSARRTILLLRQPRISALLREGGSGMTLEACNGQLEEEDPAMCALREVQEETGQTVSGLIKIGRVYASPGASLEFIHLFLCFYETLVSNVGGGLLEEGEDIETIEVSIEQAMLWIEQGVICDGRTVLAIQSALLRNVFA